MAKEVLEHPQWFGPLLEIALSEEAPLSCRAAWVVEFVCKQDPTALHGYLEVFTAGLAGMQAASSIRPMAKCCEMLAESWAKQDGDAPPLSPGQRERIAAACFDWLLGPYPVAPKAYSMQSLYLLGREAPWIHEELQAALLRGYPKGSAGYQARARRIS